MPAYYVISSIVDPTRVNIGPLSAAAGSSATPSSAPNLHLPAGVVPFTEDARLTKFRDIFGPLSHECEEPCLVRTNDDGTIDGWIYDGGP